MSTKSIFFENTDYESKGYHGEKVLFDAIKQFFDNRDCVAKHGYIMNFLGNKFTIEADTLLLDKELGINIFEVKGIRIDNIISIRTDGWICKGIYKDIIDPIYQVDRNAVNVIDFLKHCNLSSHKIGVKTIIVLPYITNEQWRSEGFDRYAFLPPIVFKDDLLDKNSFFNKLNGIPYKCTAKNKITDEEFNNIKKILFGDIEEEPTICKIISEEELLQQLLL